MRTSGHPVLTLPNLLTLARLASLPVAIALFARGHGFAAAAVFLAGMLTDCVDGWLARRLNQVSTFGLYFDPVVDKIVVLAMFYELAAAGAFSLAIPHLLLTRELLQSGVRSTAAVRGRVVGANWMGKTKAVFQTIVIVWGLLLPDLAARVRGAWMESGLAVSAWAVTALTWAFLAVFLYWNWATVAGLAEPPAGAGGGCKPDYSR